MHRWGIAAAVGVACLVLGIANGWAIDISVGGDKSDQDKTKSGGCKSVFCIGIDGKTVEKVLDKGDKQTPDTPPAGKSPVPVVVPHPQPTATGQVCITKYADLNGNGVRDGTEPAIPGWSFTIRNAAGAVVDSGTTNAQGVYCSHPLSPGAVSVQETQQTGWISTDPGGAVPVKPATIAASATVYVSFGNKASSQICVVKYNDLNGNGVQDSGEPVLSGWWFNFTTASGTVLDFGPTDAQGQFCTSHPLPPGSVTVTEQAQSGWVSTDPGGANPVKHVSVVNGDMHVAFGNRMPPPGQVCITKYNDLNGNGVRDSGEPTLPGWSFDVRNASGTILDSGVTNAQGVFCTSQPIPAGTVTVHETLQSSWTSTDPGGSHPVKTVAVPVGAAVNVSFGNRQLLGQICVLKFEDMNSTGIYDAGLDPILPGWQFTITGPSGPLTLTSGTSQLSCTPVNLLLGSYTITEVMQPGWSSTTPGGTAPHRSVMVVNGQSFVPVMFGNVRVQPGQICVWKYFDQNGNGHRDATEPPLPGWTFVVRDASGAQVATGTTDAQGRYCTAASLNGAYDVTEVQQPWWVNTDPQGPPMAQLPAHKSLLVSATHGGELQFGNTKAGQLCIHKYDDLNGNGQHDPGEPPLAGWTFRLHYTSWIAAAEDQITTDATGTACVFLPPGSTNVADEIAQPGWVNTQAAPWNYKIVQGQTVDADVGNRQVNPLIGLVCIAKYNDVNHNGAFNAGEWKLAGWQFTIKNAQGVTVGTVVTDSGPRTCLALPNGSYTAYETMQPYWHNSDPAGANPHKAFTISNGNIASLMFGNYQTAAP